MRNIIIFLSLSLLLNSQGRLAQAPFSRGVNLKDWFQAGNARQVQFTKYTRKDFINIKSLGCDAIRLPINMHYMTSGAPDYKFDPVFFNFLDSAVTWAENLKIYLILDNHSFDAAISAGPVLIKVWAQMAEHYCEGSKYIMYEILNEPHDIPTPVWGEIQQNVINAIRNKDTKHTIIVGGSNFNRYTELKNLPVYTDTNLIYTFHFYDPFLFTHQGAKWTGMTSVSGVPFPYNAAKMPSLQTSLNNNAWLDSLINNYKTDGTVAKIKTLIDEAVNFRKARNVKIFCGEWGVYIPHSENNDRVYWYEIVRKYLDENSIPWTIWDYQGGFGLMNANTAGVFDYDLNIPLLRALGFNIPAQKIKHP